MKTYFIALFLASMGTGLAQIPGPVPPFSGSWADIRAVRINNQLRQPPPPPAGGFWVVEESGSRKDPVLIRFYTDQFREIHVDTLYKSSVNIHRRSVIIALNEKLALLLGTAYKPETVAVRRP